MILIGLLLLLAVICTAGLAFCTNLAKYLSWTEPVIDKLSVI